MDVHAREAGGGDDHAGEEHREERGVYLDRRGDEEAGDHRDADEHRAVIDHGHHRHDEEGAKRGADDALDGLGNRTTADGGHQDERGGRGPLGMGRREEHPEDERDDTDGGEEDGVAEVVRTEVHPSANGVEGREERAALHSLPAITDDDRNGDDKCAEEKVERPGAGGDAIAEEREGHQHPDRDHRGDAGEGGIDPGPEAGEEADDAQCDGHGDVGAADGDAEVGRERPENREPGEGPAAGFLRGGGEDEERHQDAHRQCEALIAEFGDQEGDDREKREGDEAEFPVEGLEVPAVADFAADRRHGCRWRHVEPP